MREVVFSWGIQSNGNLVEGQRQDFFALHFRDISPVQRGGESGKIAS